VIPLYGGCVYLRGRIWWLRYAGHRESSHSTREIDAKRLLKRRLAEIAGGRFIGPAADKVTLHDLGQDFLNDYSINGRRLDRAQRSVAVLLQFFGAKARAHDLTTDWIRKYIAKRLGENMAPATVNRELAALKRMYALGMQGERISRRPHIPMLEENNVRRGFFEHAEFLALRAALPEHLKSVVTFAYYTGCRRGEILALRWEQVDLELGTVRLDPGTTKNGEGRVIPLAGELLDVMRLQWERRPLQPASDPASVVVLAPLVFHRDGHAIGDFRDAWASACKAAGLGEKLFHDFRRTAVRNMIRAGVPERVAMKISGHMTRSVFDRYNIVSEDDLKEAAQRLWNHTQAMPRLRAIPARAGNCFDGDRALPAAVDLTSDD
jgi:integrase